MSEEPKILSAEWIKKNGQQVPESKKPKVSVIITTWNGIKFTEQAIASVIAQTFEDWELWIIDDNSTDNTVEAVTKFMELDSRIHLAISDLPRSDGWRVCRYAHSINVVFPLTSGQYITYLCNDDLYIPFRLQFMVDFLDKNPEAQICYGKQLVIDVDDCNFSFVRHMPGVTRQAAGAIDHSSVMHRRECFEKVLGWNEDPKVRAIGDAAFWYRLNQYWDFHPIDEILDIHRYNKDSVNAETNQKHKNGEAHNPLKCQPDCKEGINLAKSLEDLWTRPLEKGFKVIGY